MPRLLLVSNRLPVTIRTEQGELRVEPSSGGLATGLAGPHQTSGGLWIGWPGPSDGLEEAQRAALDQKLAGLHCVPVYLSTAEINAYYEGFSNGVLWPLFHYLLDRIPVHSLDWTTYRAVNQRFADQVVRHYRPGDQIWVHDYQLALVPGMLREQLPDARIGFFLHIPFPTAEVYRILPPRAELLEGMLGADLLGFHALSYVRHFANSVLHTLGITPDVDRLLFRGREVRLGAFPMGIDAASFRTALEGAPVQEEILRIQGAAPRPRVILGVDRLDYTKGIPRRLMAIELLLERDPALRGNIVYVQVAVPSRTDIDEYAALRQQVDELVGRINGKFGTFHGVPIHYLYRSIPFHQLVAMYATAEVMLVTPLRDGMNLVAKEYVACRAHDDGVLILSEFAGAASELGDAILVNPYDVDGMADAIQQALAMSPEDQGERMRDLRARVFKHDVHAWARSFLDELSRTEPAKPVLEELPSPPAEVERALQRMLAAGSLLLCLDYDGTLVPIANAPELAKPDPALRTLLTQLAQRPRTEVHVITGRPPEKISRWLGDLPIGLHAEHGLWSRPVGAPSWIQTRQVPTDWKDRVRPVLEQFALRTPGAFVEEKHATIAWHYRRADPEFGPRQARELQLHLTQTLSNLPVEIIAGHKVIELRPHGVQKGLIIDRLTANRGGLLVAMGDDRTDEDMFAAAPEGALTFHVGSGPSRAHLRLTTPAAVRSLLAKLL